MPPSISAQSASRDVAGALLVPVFPGVRARAELLAAPVAAQHRPGGHVDERQPHRDRAHDEAGRGLVAAAHQHRAVDRIGAQVLLRLHREQVAVEHGRGLLERLRQRHARDLDREAAGLQDAALHVLGARLEVRVAGVDVAPRIEDGDHRLARPVVGVVAHLAQPRAMPERAQILDAEPAVGAQVVGRLRVVMRVRLRLPCARLIGSIAARSAAMARSAVRISYLVCRFIQNPTDVPKNFARRSAVSAVMPSSSRAIRSIRVRGTPHSLRDLVRRQAHRLQELLAEHLAGVHRRQRRHDFHCHQLLSDNPRSRPPPGRFSSNGSKCAIGR